jgi:hypothetical protein
MATLMKMPGKGLARTAAKAAGLAVINAPLVPIMEPMRVAAAAREFMQRDDSYLGSQLTLNYLERARSMHPQLLASLPQARLSYEVLSAILIPPFETVSYAQVSTMLGALFGALAKRKDENAALLLAACCDLFDPVSLAIGESTGLWKPISNHPIVVALAIKRLLAKQVFTPTPSEVRDAIKLAAERVDTKTAYVGQFIALADQADAMLFLFDHPAWQMAHASASREASLAMRAEAELSNYDVEDNAKDESPRSQALAEIISAKQQLPVRQAACKTLPAKRTTRKPSPRKPKGG